MAQSLVTTGNYILDSPGIGIEGGRTLRGVECGKPAAGPSANINQPATVADGFGNRVDGQRDLRQRFLHGSSHFLVFLINDAGDLQRGFGVQIRGSEVGLLRPELTDADVAYAHVNASTTASWN